MDPPKPPKPAPLPRVCQVDGCGLDLSTAKTYLQRHRTCQEHLRSLECIVGGVPSRWCQQCARFHSVEEFDATKRSCRTRLSQHNARRRRKAGAADDDDDDGTAPASADNLSASTPATLDMEATEAVVGSINLLPRLSIPAMPLGGGLGSASTPEVPGSAVGERLDGCSAYSSPDAGVAAGYHAYIAATGSSSGGCTPAMSPAAAASHAAAAALGLPPRSLRIRTHHALADCESGGSSSRVSGEMAALKGPLSSSGGLGGSSRRRSSGLAGASSPSAAQASMLSAPLTKVNAGEVRKKERRASRGSLLPQRARLALEVDNDSSSPTTLMMMMGLGGSSTSPMGLPPRAPAGGPHQSAPCNAMFNPHGGMFSPHEAGAGSHLDMVGTLGGSMGGGLGHTGPGSSLSLLDYPTGGPPKRGSPMAVPWQSASCGRLPGAGSITGSAPGGWDLLNGNTTGGPGVLYTSMAPQDRSASATYVTVPDFAAPQPQPTQQQQQQQVMFMLQQTQGLNLGRASSVPLPIQYPGQSMGHQPSGAGMAEGGGGHMPQAGVRYSLDERPRANMMGQQDMHHPPPTFQQGAVQVHVHPMTAAGAAFQTNPPLAPPAGAQLESLSHQAMAHHGQMAPAAAVYMHDMMAMSTKLAGGSTDDPGTQDEAQILMDLGLGDCLDFEMLDVGHPNRSSLPGQFLLPGMMPATGGSNAAAGGHNGVGAGSQQTGAGNAPVTAGIAQLGTAWAPVMPGSGAGAAKTGPPAPASHHPHQQQLGTELANNSRLGQQYSSTAAPAPAMTNAGMSNSYVVKPEPGHEWRASAAAAAGTTVGPIWATADHTTPGSQGGNARPGVHAHIAQPVTTGIFTRMDTGGLETHPQSVPQQQVVPVLTDNFLHISGDDFNQNGLNFIPMTALPTSHGGASASTQPNHSNHSQGSSYQSKPFSNSSGGAKDSSYPPGQSDQELLNALSLKVGGCLPQQLSPEMHARLTDIVARKDTQALRLVLLESQV